MEKPAFSNGNFTDPVWDPNLAKLLDDGPCLPNDTRDLAALLQNDGATVDGLMAEIRHPPVEVGRKNPWFDKVFIYPSWLFGISSINSINKVKVTFHQFHPNMFILKVSSPLPLSVCFLGGVGERFQPHHLSHNHTPKLWQPTRLHLLQQHIARHIAGR